MDSETKEKETRENGSEYKAGTTASASEDVAQARIRFLEAAETFEPFGIVRNHPFLSLGGALAAGMGVNRFIKTTPYLSLLPLIIQIAALTAKFGLLAMDNTNKKDK